MAPCSSLPCTLTHSAAHHPCFHSSKPTFLTSLHATPPCSWHIMIQSRHQYCKKYGMSSCNKSCHYVAHVQSCFMSSEVTQHAGGAAPSVQGLKVRDRTRHGVLLTLSSSSTGAMPKKGRVAEPGTAGHAPGSGVIIAAPVSVCHQVSTIGQRPSPTTCAHVPSISHYNTELFFCSQKWSDIGLCRCHQVSTVKQQPSYQHLRACAAIQ